MRASGDNLAKFLLISAVTGSGAIFYSLAMVTALSALVSSIMLITAVDFVRFRTERRFKHFLMVAFLSLAFVIHSDVPFGKDVANNFFRFYFRNPAVTWMFDAKEVDSPD